MSTSNTNRPLHLLSLDGGGVRGLSSIMILKYLMANISKQRGYVVQPWEEFDMIGGTSTGGLIAIMLGRLRMTLDECEKAYLNLSERIFIPKRSTLNPLRSKDFLLADGKFDYKVLEKAIKDIIVRDRGLEESTLFQDSDPQCKVFVCATRTGNTEVAIFRSYDTTEPELLFEECKIWEACRATSAATTFFDPIKIGRYSQEFADGGVLYNNPIQLVEQEASAIWPDRMESAVMVSIGTGSAPGGAFRGSLEKIIKAMREIVTKSEKTHDNFFRAHKEMVHQNRYHRFNVFYGLADVGLEESKEKEKMANTTQTYLAKGETQSLLNSCIQQLCKSGPPRVGPSPVDNNREQRGSTSIDARNSQKAYSRRELSDCIYSLSFKGMDSRQNNIRLAHQDTCEWLFKTQSFRKWKDRTDLQSNNGTLSIQGHPGVGKSTLMKHTLLYCQKEFKNYKIASYFFNARGGPLERCPLGMLRSLIVQLLEQNPSLQEQFIASFLTKKIRYRESGLEWETGELKESLLREWKSRQCEDTLLLIDALDECNDSDVYQVVDFLEELGEYAIKSGSNLRICLSSRHYPNIDIKKKIRLVVEQQAEHDRDILKYVQSKLKTTNQEMQTQILEKAKHIFIWVILVVELLNKEFICGNITAMWKKLKEIPSDLDKLFSKLLERDDSEDDKKKTILVFQWVLFSRRALTATELYFAVLAGTDPDDLGPWDRSRVEFEAIKRFITSASRGLVEIVSNDNDDRGERQYIVQFIHQSIIDYLTRNQRLVKLDPTLAPNAIGTSHARLASCCMAYLMQEKLRSLAMDASSRANYVNEFFDEVKESYPFLQYSSIKLLAHAESAQAEGISQLSLLRRLEKRRNYEILQFWYGSQVHRSDNFKGAPLLYAVSQEGCYHLVQTLIFENRADINIQGGYYGTALQAVATWGHEDIVALLLEHGADVNTQGGHYGTALQAAAANYRNTDTIMLLLKYGADVNAQGGYHGTALQVVAARHENIDIAMLFLKHGADINAQARHYGTALQAAARHRNMDIVALLLKHGADVNAQGGHYGTALQAAAAPGPYRNKDIVELLLKHGADVNAQGGHYGTALQAATAIKNTDIVALLLKHGAIPIPP